MDNRPQTMGTKVAAEILGVSQPTVSKWCRETDFFPNAIQDAKGSPWHIPVDEVYALLEKRSVS